MSLSNDEQKIIDDYCRVLLSCVKSIKVACNKVEPFFNDYLRTHCAASSEEIDNYLTDIVNGAKILIEVARKSE